MGDDIASMRVGRAAAEWMLGAAGGVLALGPALRPGSILRLDFVLLPHAPVPNGVWGLGPELPRRTPLLLPLAWLDPVVGSVAAGKALVVLAIAAAFVGACRMVGDLAVPWRWTAGLVYACNPFVMTRLAVGHLFVLATMGVLPWVVPWVLRRDRGQLRRLYLGATALALTGVLGGVFSIGLGAAVAGRQTTWRRRLGALSVALLAQVAWLAPGIVVWLQGADPASSTQFPTRLGGAGGVLGLLAGQGFWQDTFQVGVDRGVAVPLLGLVLLGVAILGHRDLPATWRAPVAGGAALAFVAVVASGWTATQDLYRWLTDLPGGAALREGQRLLPLFLLWQAPAAALGGARLAARLPRVGDLARVVPLAAALLLVGPGLWGAGGQLRSVDLPADWARARALVRAQPGTVLALPWFQYLDLDLAGGSRVLNPLPLWLGGDVLAASDPRLPGGPGAERNDPREPAAARLVAAGLRGEAIADDLAALGVRWVVVLRDGDPLRGTPVGIVQAEALRGDPGLRPALTGSSLEVFEVRGWRGPVVTTTDGDAVTMHRRIGPFASLAASGEAVWNRPAAAGWLRGWSAATTSANGRLVLPGGSGLVWYWPSVLVLLAYLTSIIVVLFLLIDRLRARLLVR